MKQDPFRLRDQLARPTLKRIGADRERVSKALTPALEVIERRLFDRGLDVNAVWRESGVPRTCSTLFRPQLGETPLEYIGTCRVEVAAKLVVRTDLKLSVIADAVGYPTTTNTFARAFQRRTGMSPSTYRRAARNSRDGAEDRVPADDRAPKDLSRLMCRVGLASAAGDFEGAKLCISQVSSAVHELEIQELAAKLAIICHERAAQRTREADVDRAYDDLALARRCYDQAGDLEPALRRRRRHITVSHLTDEALTSSLCPDCGAKLAGEEGRTVREALSQALRFVSRGLNWFEVCCDDCYQVVWSAISRARAGLMNDAWKAWWLSVNADLADRETPPSQGRIIAALSEVERLVSGDQLERRGYCDLALDDALALGDPLLEIQARIWRASVLRATGDLTEAKAELRHIADAGHTAPWLAALHDRIAATLESHTNHWQKALNLFRRATAVYKKLDPHLSGLLLTEVANIQFFLAEYENSIARNQEALSLLDGRRDPLPSDGIVPLNSSMSFALLGKWDRAESALSRCRYQREAHPGLAATETLTRACFELLRDRPRESLELFGKAKERFKRIHQPLDVALAASYSVEAYVRIGDRRSAIENTMAALTFFHAAGCSQDTMDALAKLQALLETEAVDVMAVTAGARSLARRHGGWLPPDPG